MDYGRTRANVRHVRIKWVAAHWLQAAFASNTRMTENVGCPALTKREVAPADQHNSPGLKRWTKTVDLPSAGAHAMWRVVALHVPTNNFFGLDTLEFFH